MSERIFDRETLLDLTVNIVPLGIILFFFVVFLLVEPWEFDPFIMLVSMGLLVIPFFGLALLTYVSGLAIEGSEETEARTETLSESSETDETADDTDDVTALNEGNNADEDDEADGGGSESTADAESGEERSTETDDG